MTLSNPFSPHRQQCSEPTYFTVSATFALWVTVPIVAVNISVKVPWFTFFDDCKVTEVVAVPFNTTLVVFTVQVEFAGAPLQETIAEPVSPPIGVSTIVNMAE